MIEDQSNNPEIQRLTPASKLIRPAKLAQIRAQFTAAELDTQHVLLLGFGKLNQALAQELLELGCRVTAISRTLKSGPKMSAVRQILGDLSNPAFIAQLARLLKMDPPAAVVIAVTPDGRSVQNYRETYLGIARSVSQLLAALSCRVVQVSSTGVYAQDDGQHLTELSPPSLHTAKALVLYQAEQIYRVAIKDRLSVVRPSGIYSENRRYLIRAAIEAQNLKANQWTNRIHERDLIAVLLYAISSRHAEPVLLATDSSPITKDVAVNWIRDRLGLRQITPDDAPTSGKRLRSIKLPKTLFGYPSYRVGYGHAQLGLERAKLSGSTKD